MTKIRINDIMKRPYGATSAPGLLESAMNIDDNGHSNWNTIFDLEKKTGVRITGATYIFSDKPNSLGSVFVIDKMYRKGRVYAVRSVGFNKKRRIKGKIPAYITQVISEMLCAGCGTSTDIQVDHKDGRLSHNGPLSLDDCQPLCHHCNNVKRHYCFNICKVTNKRYNAKKIQGFAIPFTVGTEDFDPNGLRCIGCYWYDCLAFKGYIGMLPDSYEDYIRPALLRYQRFLGRKVQNVIDKDNLMLYEEMIEVQLELVRMEDEKIIWR